MMIMKTVAIKKENKLLSPIPHSSGFIPIVRFFSVCT